MFKYPRTRHLAGSRLQPGDEDADAAPTGELAGRHVVVEEKMDGANAGVSFGPDGELRLQSRGNYLTGGPRERQFALFKQWAAAVRDELFDRLGGRYVLYGEWVYAKHTVFYDALPHYFLEFDVLDTETGAFLDTPRRAELLAGLRYHPVRVLYAGPFPGEAALRAMVGPSAFRTPEALAVLAADARRYGCDPELVLRQTDPSPLMEGLYVKAEDGGAVTGRYKFVRPDFVQRQADEGHWQDRPLVPNRLAPAADLFG